MSNIYKTMSKTTDKKEQENKQVKDTLILLFVNLAAMFAVVAVAVFITFRCINNYTEHGVALIVPDVTGLEEADAMSELTQHDFVGVVSDHVYVKGVASGEIISQRPVAQAKVKRGRKGYLTVSSGNQPMIAIPDIADNSSLRQAESRLRAAGFKLAPNDTIKGDLDWVYEVRYKGRELQNGELVPEGAELTLVIGGGDKMEAETLVAPTVEDGWF